MQFRGLNCNRSLTWQKLGIMRLIRARSDDFITPQILLFTGKTVTYVDEIYIHICIYIRICVLFCMLHLAQIITNNENSRLFFPRRISVSRNFSHFPPMVFIFRRVLAIKLTFHDSTIVYAMPTYARVRSQSFQVK